MFCSEERDYRHPQKQRAVLSALLFFCKIRIYRQCSDFAVLLWASCRKMRSFSIVVV